MLDSARELAIRDQQADLESSNDVAQAASHALIDVDDGIATLRTRAIAILTLPAMNDYEEVLARLRLHTNEFIASRTGASALAYVDDVVALYGQAFPPLVNAFIDLAGFEIDIVERTIAFNANPLVLEVRFTS
jgi:hypothetical protein